MKDEDLKKLMNYINDHQSNLEAIAKFIKEKHTCEDFKPSATALSKTGIKPHTVAAYILGFIEDKLEQEEENYHRGIENDLQI